MPSYRFNEFTEQDAGDLRLQIATISTHDDHETGESGKTYGPYTVLYVTGKPYLTLLPADFRLGLDPIEPVVDIFLHGIAEVEIRWRWLPGAGESGPGGRPRSRIPATLPVLELQPEEAIVPKGGTQPIQTVDLAVQIQEIRQAGAVDLDDVPAGRLLGLPELPGGGVWVDIAGAAAVTGLEPKTISGYLNRAQPKRCPFPDAHRILYRLYWPLSTLLEWCEEYAASGAKEKGQG